MAERSRPVFTPTLEPGNDGVVGKRLRHGVGDVGRLVVPDVGGFEPVSKLAIRPPAPKRDP